VASPPPRHRPGPGLLEVGRIGRPHGLRGEVLVVLSTDRDERLAPGARLSSERGDLVVRASRRHQDRWIVSFEGRDTREQAEELRGAALLAEPLDDPAELWVHELVGADVVTTAGESLGRCTAVVANPAADLIELDGGALVPVVFVVDHAPGDGAPGRVTVDPPEGLLDL
jgi:16S rRNA processing protein RimM